MPVSVTVVSVTTVAPLELHHLSSLRGLDLSHNMLSETPEQLAVVLNRMPRLLMVAVRGNQQLSKKGARIKLLSCMSSVVRGRRGARVGERVSASACV